MKLKSKDCDNEVNGRLCSYPSEDKSTPKPEKYSDECIKYKLSSCFKESMNYSQWKNLNCRWSGGGNCEWKLRVETESIGRCELYCKYDQTYAVDSGKPDISVKVRKVQKEWSQKVEIEFNTSEKITLTHRLFNDTETIVAVSLLPLKDQDSVLRLNSGGNTLVTSVIGVVLSPRFNKTIPNLVIAEFTHPKVLQEKVIRKCVFWKEDIWTPNGSWSSEGCTLLNESSTERTVCSCNHLTNFAVLMQYKPVQNPKEHETSLSIITYIGCALSLIGEVMVVIIYVVFMKFRAEGIQIRINLAAALFLAQVVFLSGINATINRLACVSVAVLLHYFYLASFGWMLLEGVYLYIMVVEVFASTVKLLYLYLFAWGFPVIPVVISLVVGFKDGEGLRYYTNEHFCWLSFSKHLSWFFVGPVLLIMAVNFVILLAVLREIRNLQEPNPTRLKAFKKSLKACVILSPLLGVTWIFGLLAVTDAGLVFQYIFTILNSAQRSSSLVSPQDIEMEVP
ncbi:adhesion G-protein coupled receptor D1-like isoform X2 [Porites lutea]|uniref:adhesion G-protein coupled receptor D1-like isoform X2 n=1 Tax=Porites lutea TaxID=51062 RepID=UPI003CC6AB92